MYKRILAIGDIHGEYGKLVDLYGKIGFNPAEDLLVFLGDYIDRGPEPLEVLDWMMKREDAPNIVMLRGNHEQMMLDHYVPKARQKTLGWDVPEFPYEDWLAPDNGGGVTDRALRRFAARIAEQRGMPAARRWVAKVWRFIAGLPLSHRVEVGGRTYFFCHGGVRSIMPLDEQDPHDLLTLAEAFFLCYNKSPMVVVGHTQVGGVRRAFGMKPALEPVVQDNMILVDTAACEGGPLACVDALSGRVWRSDATKTRSLATCGNRLVVNIWNLFKSKQ